MSLGIFVIYGWLVHCLPTLAEFHWTAQLSSHPMSASSFLISFSVYVLSGPELVWKFQLEYWNRFLARAVHSFTSLLCPLEELEVLCFPFFSFSEVINGLSDKSSVLTRCRALHIWGVAPVELIMHRAEHSLVGWNMSLVLRADTGWADGARGGWTDVLFPSWYVMRGDIREIRSPNEVRPDVIRCVQSWRVTKPAPKPQDWDELPSELRLNLISCFIYGYVYEN